MAEHRSTTYRRKRREMGEEAWAEYQRQRKNAKADAYRRRHARQVVEWRRRTKLKLVAYKGSKCLKCGYDKPIAAVYHFHHRDPTKKSFQIGGCSIQLKRLKLEADKCDLLCANCHAELHDEENCILNERTISSLIVANC